MNEKERLKILKISHNLLDKDEIEKLPESLRIPLMNVTIGTCLCYKSKTYAKFENGDIGYKNMPIIINKALNL